MPPQTMNDTPFYPPSVVPPPHPLPLWRFLPTFLRNPLRSLPEPVYHMPVVAPDALAGRLAWVTDPVIIEHVLLGEHDKFPKSPIERRIFAPILGEGILIAEGASWRWQRRTVAPLFRHGDLLGFVPAFARVAEDQVQRWRRLPNTVAQLIDRDMTDVTFNALSATLFAGATADEEAALKRHIGAYLERTSWDIAFEMLGLSPRVWHPAKRAMRRSATALRRTIDGIIARERTAGWQSGGLIARLGTATDPETGQPMSDDLVASNLLTFAAAGHETTAKALSWTLYLLAHSPGWQQRLRDEVNSAAENAPITEAHIDRLVLTRQVLKEAMRLYPPAPVIARRVLETTSINGHTFQSGAMLVIPIYALHRHRALWDDPDRFDPDRFSPERENSMHRAQYIPFGFGQRTCIGMGFAMIEAVVLLATFMRDARFEAAANRRLEPVSRVTLRPRGGIRLHVETLDR